MSNESKEQKATMTKEEETVMLAELSHRVMNLTSDYVENIRKMFQTYPELKEAFDIVVAMNVFDHNAVRLILCNSHARDNIVTELQSL